jgi:hypothetical protein
MASKIMKNKIFPQFGRVFHLDSFPNIPKLVLNGIQPPQPLWDGIKAPLRENMRTSLMVQGYVVEI